jgi:GDPmannose 4,6-dehydratase
MDFKKKVLVLGVNGQDGSYIAESQIALGNFVYGVGRQSLSRWVSPCDNFKYIELNLIDLKSLENLLNSTLPDLIFHFSAVHGPSGYDYESVWSDMHVVNMLTVNLILEHIRSKTPGVKMIYASSSKALSSNLQEISEDSPKTSNCLYTITKNTAHDLMLYYRNKHGVDSSTVWLFNHESIRRPEGYFVHKITDIIISSLQDKRFYCDIGDLNFWCDWGDAKEYMHIISSSISNVKHHDFLLSTGVTINAQIHCKELFLAFNLNIEDHVKIYTDTDNFIKVKPPWRAKPEKLLTMCNTSPKNNFLDVCTEIIYYKLGAL